MAKDKKPVVKKLDKVIEGTGTVGGAVAGGTAGAVTGGAIGTLFCPGVGTAVGAGIGALAAGSAGGAVGKLAGKLVTGTRKIGTAVYRNVNTKTTVSKEQAQTSYAPNMYSSYPQANAPNPYVNGTPSMQSSPAVNINCYSQPCLPPTNEFYPPKHHRQQTSGGTGGLYPPLH